MSDLDDINTRSKVFLFRDFDLWHKKDSLGYNKFSYVFSDGATVLLKRGRVSRQRPRCIRRKPTPSVISLRGHPKLNEIDCFFQQNCINVPLFEIAKHEIGNTQSQFWDDPVKFPVLSNVTLEERKERWQNFFVALKPGDIIHTMNTKNIISKIISYVTQSPWSHAAVYVGNGMIIEATTPNGVTETNLEKYNDPKFRLGLYRIELSDEQETAIVAKARESLGTPYGYRGVLALGLKLALGLWTLKVRYYYGPCTLVIRGGAKPICFV